MQESGLHRSLFIAQTREHREHEFRTLLDSEKEALRQAWQSEGMLTCALFCYQRLLFVYTEGLVARETLRWPDVFVPLLDDWPGRDQPRQAAPMMDIYHNSRPVDGRSWREGYVPERRHATLAMLRPELYSSYIYYHYQLQEESPGSFNKYYMIAAHENMIVSYSEFPAIKDIQAPSEGFDIKRSPKNWKDVMVPHFIPWSMKEEPELYLDMEHLFSFPAS